jgi:hypothetical protein
MSPITVSSLETEIINSAISGDIAIAISEPIIVETIRVLRQDFDWQPYRLLDLRQRLLKICRLVEAYGKSGCGGG